MKTLAFFLALVFPAFGQVELSFLATEPADVAGCGTIAGGQVFSGAINTTESIGGLFSPAYKTNMAVKFTASESSTICSVRLTNIYVLGTPTGNAYASIWTTNGAAGDAAIPLAMVGGKSAPLDVATLGTSAGASAVFADLSASLTSGVEYFMSIDYNAGSTGNYVRIGVGDWAGNGVYINTDTGVWTFFDNHHWAFALLK
jgi:hypothetical protein